MAWPTSTFPTALDEITDIVDNVSEAKADDINGAYDAIEKLEAKVGVDSSAVATSLDYRVAALETGADLNMTGEANATSNTAETTIDVGTVTNGDRIYCSAYVHITNSTALKAAYLALNKKSGTATVSFAPGLGTGVAAQVQSMSDGATHYIYISAVCKVTGDGTLVLRSMAAGVGSPSYDDNSIYVFFLKKA